MNSEYFFAQDQSGNLQKVHVNRSAAQQNSSLPQASYVLEDGSQLKRIDSETFQILDTGAFVTLVRE